MPAAAPTAARRGSSVKAAPWVVRVLRLFVFQRELTPTLITVGLFIYFALARAPTSPAR